MKTTPEFDAALVTWLERAQKVILENHERQGFTFAPSTLSIERGRRYARIVSTDAGSRYAFAFVDLESGDVLKPDGWKGPTKNFARGNIFDPERLGVGAYGAHTCPR